MTSSDRLRVDKWLWAARFFKTRAQAAEAVDGGKVEVNGARVKPSKELKVGDELRIRLGPYEHVVAVRAISDRRGPASVAHALYAETPDSVAARERLREERRLAPAMFVYEDKGRPTKKDRRALADFIERRRRR
jgi:ribosome-associated heat shock protein Hsp15